MTLSSKSAPLSGVTVSKFIVALNEGLGVHQWDVRVIQFTDGFLKVRHASGPTQLALCPLTSIETTRPSDRLPTHDLLHQALPFSTLLPPFRPEPPDPVPDLLWRRLHRSLLHRQHAGRSHLMQSFQRANLACGDVISTVRQ